MKRARSRLRPLDVLLAGTVGLRARRLRTAFSALGISIGIAAIVGVLGVTQSSQADLLARIDRLGTNLLTVENGQGVSGSEGQLPLTAPSMIRMVRGVQAVTPTAQLPGGVFRTNLVPSYLSGGISLRATAPSLLTTLRGSLLAGTFLSPASEHYPVAVLGFAAARSLGIGRLDGHVRIWAAGHWLTVIGILGPDELAPEIDSSVLIGLDYAQAGLNFDGHPTRLYVRADPEHVATISTLLPRTSDPASPDQVQVTRPSDALTARVAVQSSSTTLVIGLGAVALLIGGVGVANIMVIAVLERRSEIGLRRALGATRLHVALQFLAESLMLALIGGFAGIAAGGLVTAAYAVEQGWAIVVPALAVWGGLAAAIVVGGAAGLYPALRAARLAPGVALRLGP